MNYCDGMIIKYDADGNVEWATNVGGSKDDYINSVSEADDEGILAVGHFDSNSIQIGQYTLEKYQDPAPNTTDGMVIKYDKEGNVKWVNKVGESDSDYINSVSATEDGGAIVGGSFKADSIKIGDFILENQGFNRRNDNKI